MIGKLAFALVLIVARAAAVADDVNKQVVDQRVLVEIYYQTLCPYCIRFITQQLKPVLSIPNIWQVANFRLIPFGNGNMTKQGSSYSFTCQFGEAECQGNIIQNCALNLYDVQSKALPYIICLEESDKDWGKDGAKCTQKIGIDYGGIKSCTNSMYGRHWQYQAGLETKFIGITRVPYVVLNGVYDAAKERSVVTDLLGAVCTNYRGNVKLPQCK